MQIVPSDQEIQLKGLVYFFLKRLKHYLNIKTVRVGMQKMTFAIFIFESFNIIQTKKYRFNFFDHVLRVPNFFKY